MSNYNQISHDTMLRNAVAIMRSEAALKLAAEAADREYQVTFMNVSPEKIPSLGEEQVASNTNGLIAVYWMLMKIATLPNGEAIFGFMRSLLIIIMRMDSSAIAKYLDMDIESDVPFMAQWKFSRTNKIMGVLLDTIMEVHCGWLRNCAHRGNLSKRANEFMNLSVLEVIKDIVAIRAGFFAIANYRPES